LANLLDEVIEAHGGLARWAQLETIHARLTQGGVTWALKGHPDELSDVYVTVRLHEQSVSHRPFLEPGLHSCYTPSRVSIERADETEVEALEDRIHVLDLAGRAGRRLPGGLSVARCRR
jgi:hypothetical protein